jgi:hypothetical protein
MCSSSVNLRLTEFESAEKTKKYQKCWKRIEKSFQAIGRQYARDVLNRSFD